MKDERIQTTVNRISTVGLLICLYFLLPISILYRMLILKQHIREFWDIFAIFCFGIFFTFIAYARKGVFDYGFKRTWLTIFTIVFIVNLTLFFIIGLIDSFVDVVEYVIGFLFGMTPVIAIAYLLNRQWKRKEGIEDEK